MDFLLMKQHFVMLLIVFNECLQRRLHRRLTPEEKTLVLDFVIAIYREYKSQMKCLMPPEVMACMSYVEYNRSAIGY